MRRGWTAASGPGISPPRCARLPALELPTRLSSRHASPWRAKRRGRARCSRRCLASSIRIWAIYFAAFSGWSIMKGLRKRCGWRSKHRARQWRGKTPTNGGANAAFSPASCSMSVTQKPPTKSCAAPPPRRMSITVPKRTSWQAGSHCVFSTIPRWHSLISSTSMMDRPIPSCSHERVTGAAALLYSIGERDLAVRFVAALAEQSEDATALAALAEVTVDHEDPQATLLIGKGALARGLPLDPYAFSTVGLPPYKPMGPEIDPSIVYAVMRTESGFGPRDASPANAVGLMQVTPEAGRDTASRFGLPYDWTRLICDPVYNTQMGAAELAGLMRDYRGSLVLIFAGYNAGRGRVEKWIAQYGDPRDPKVDPIDWVERIPFAETRNYVEGVLENQQVYRTRFAKGVRAEALRSTEMSANQSRH